MKKLQESGEMYLETIYILSQKQEFVRSIDVAEYMDFSKASVSRAMGHLKTGGYIEMDSDRHIKLTASGLKIAKKIYERHVVLTKLFKYLGVDDETAQADACRIEHDISDASFEVLKKHINEEHGI